MQVVSIVVACGVSDVPLRVLLPRAWCWWDVTPTHLSVGTWAGTVSLCRMMSRHQRHVPAGLPIGCGCS
jgi:hypothetical protein